MQPQSTSIRQFLFYAFGLGWLVQLGATYAYWHQQSHLYTLGLLLTMLTPTVAVCLSKHSLRQFDWRPHFQRNLFQLARHWFVLCLLFLMGATLYFGAFPETLSLSFNTLAVPFSPPSNRPLPDPIILAIITFLNGILIAPWLNMPFALGEEIGWRGILYPALKARYGTVRGQIIGGIIWGIWHWPLLLLVGYEYGFHYFGAPILGLLIFCLFTTSVGILLNDSYTQSGSLWLPAILHGGINAIAGLPLMCLNPSVTPNLILGPSAIGLISGIPLFAFAIWISRHPAKT